MCWQRREAFGYVSDPPAAILTHDLGQSGVTYGIRAKFFSQIRLQGIFAAFHKMWRMGLDLVPQA